MSIFERKRGAVVAGASLAAGFYYACKIEPARIEVCSRSILLGLGSTWCCRKLPEEGAAILLANEPDFADVSAATGRFDLQLSGHSHGGQVRLPFLGPVVRPLYGMKYADGLHRVGGMLLYANRGLGLLKSHLRFNCRPEITIPTLLAPL